MRCQQAEKPKKEPKPAAAESKKDAGKDEGAQVRERVQRALFVIKRALFLVQTALYNPRRASRKTQGEMRAHRCGNEYAALWCNLCCSVVRCGLQCGAVFIVVCLIVVQCSAAAESRKDEGTDEGAYVRRTVCCCCRQCSLCCKDEGTEEDAYVRCCTDEGTYVQRRVCCYVVQCVI